MEEPIVAGGLPTEKTWEVYNTQKLINHLLLHGSWEEDDLRIYLAPQCPYTIYPNHGPLVPSLLIPEVDEGKIYREHQGP
jgi:hypothetical protein